MSSPHNLLCRPTEDGSFFPVILPKLTFSILVQRHFKDLKYQLRFVEFVFITSWPLQIAEFGHILTLLPATSFSRIRQQTQFFIDFD
jgi:hypothetical protein